jgi:hypothetical protein
MSGTGRVCHAGARVLAGSLQAAGKRCYNWPVRRRVRHTESGIRECPELTGEEEAMASARASRGLPEKRFEQALMTYAGGIGSSEAAGIAGMDRHTFIVRALEHGVMDGGSEAPTLLRDLAAVAEVLRDERLAAAVASVSRRA